MRILDAGHIYRLEGYNGGESQVLTFIKRQGDGFPFNEGEHGGTNCQEVLRALIDRTEYMMRQIPCAETEAAVGCMKTALFLFESRAARRHSRHLDLPDLSAAVRMQPCTQCGHLGCELHEATKGKQ